MNLLLDSHPLLWFLRGDPRLSPHARALIEDPANRKLVSIASCWEIAIKAQLGKLHLAEPARSLLDREIARNHFELLAIEFDQTLPLHHRDPFDRLLIVQSLMENIPIVSADGALDQYGVQRLW